jgi:hypothetical protein
MTVPKMNVRTVSDNRIHKGRVARIPHLFGTPWEFLRLRCHFQAAVPVGKRQLLNMIDEHFFINSHQQMFEGTGMQHFCSGMAAILAGRKMHLGRLAAHGPTLTMQAL